MKQSHIRVSRQVLIAVSFGLLTLGTAAQAQVEPVQDNVTPAETDIVVTAQKRVETLIEVPMSISVVGGDTLERRQATSHQDLLALVPGLSLQTSKPGVGRLVLRGINAGGAGATIGVYIDETPFGSSSGLVNGSILAADFDTFDIARVEVLRGPQGTLYGASSLGGVLKYVTNQPKLNTFEARLRTGMESTKGGDTGYSGTAVVNIPLAESLAIRASGFYRKTGGFVDSIGTAGSDVEDNINGSKSYGGRISALFKPSDTLSVRLSALLQNIDGNGSSAIEVDPRTLKPLYGRLSQSRFVPEFSNISYRLYNGTIDWDLGFANLISSTSYATFDQALVNDLSFNNGPDITAVFGHPVTRPLGLFLDQTVKQRKLTQELRLSSSSHNQFEWLIGAYYTRETGELYQDYMGFDVILHKSAIGLPVISQSLLDSVYKEYAGFANATWHITDRFDLSFGGRYSRNEQRARQISEDWPNGPVFYPVGRSSENVFTYSVAPRFALNDNVAVYARVAKGYRPGGPNVIPLNAPAGTPRTYASDSLVSYEMGLKANLLDRTFSIDAAAFYLKWSDIQLPAVINNTAINGNGDTAVSKGFEFTATSRPIRGLSISLNGAYTDARLTADTSSLVGGLKKDRLPYTPQWAINLNGSYEWTLSGSTTAFVGGGLRFVGEQTGDFDRAYRAAQGRPIVLPSYEAIDLNAGINFGGWSIEAFVKNLGNSTGRTSVSRLTRPPESPNNALRSGVLRPRTIGLSLSGKF